MSLITNTQTLAPSKAVWSDAQLAQVHQTNRNKSLYSAKYGAILRFTSGYELDTRLSITSWLGSVFTDRLADLIAPELPTLTLTGTNKAVIARQTSYASQLFDQLNLRQLLGPTAKRVSWNGSAFWKLYWSPALQQPALRLWGARDGEYAFTEVDPADPVAVKAIQFWYPSVVTEQGKPKTYYLCERQSIEDGALRITNTAYATQNGIPVGDPVPLVTAWPATSQPPEPEARIPGVSLLLGARIDNVDASGDGTGDSDYSEALVSLQFDIISLMTQRRVVIERLEMPKLSIPSEYCDELGNPKWEQITIAITQNGEDAVPVKVWEWSGGLADSKEHYTLLKDQLYQHIPISPILLGEGVGGNESGTAKAYDLRASSVAVAQRRSNYNHAVLWLLQASQQLTAAYGALDVPPISGLELEWAPVEVEDPAQTKQLDLQERQVMLAELAAGVLSKEKYIRHINPAEADTEAEMARLMPDMMQP